MIGCSPFASGKGVEDAVAVRAGEVLARPDDEPERKRRQRTTSSQMATKIGRNKMDYGGYNTQKRDKNCGAGRLANALANGDAQKGCNRNPDAEVEWLGEIAPALCAGGLGEAIGQDHPNAEG